MVSLKSKHILTPYYHGLLMRIDTFRSYQAQSYTPQQQACYESILQKFEDFQLQTAHQIELDHCVVLEGLPWYLQVSRVATSQKIKHASSSEALWLASMNDFKLGIVMMEKYLQNHQQKLSAPQLQIIVKQIHQTYHIGIQQKLISAQSDISVSSV